MEAGAAKAEPETAAAVDPRNQLNDLTGREWIQETTTVWRQRGLGAGHPETKYERLHPAPFSFQDVARIIRFFTKEGMIVLDPFAGVASTLKAAALEGRRGLGVELSPEWAELGRQRLAEEVPDDSEQEIWCMDVRDALQSIESESVDLIVTSPPYWSILNKRPDHKVLEVRVANGLEQNYSDDRRDLGNIQSYSEFLAELTDIFVCLGDKLRPGKYCAIIGSDFKHGDRFYPFHSDLHARLDGRGLQLQGITILHQPQKALYPYGYPFAYVPNIHHQYVLLFRRPKEQPRRPRIRQAAVRVPEDLDARVAALRELPHKRDGMSARNWGHARHSICSFPSKMKPALASVLVDLFSLPDSVVLDPFGGCGTIPFEAALKGRPTVSNDLSPLAHAITSAKVTPPRAGACEYLLAELEETIRARAKSADLDAMEPEILDFFHRRTARELVVAREFLASVSDNFHVNEEALFVVACLAHILHGNRPYALSRRSHNIIPIPPKGPKEYKPLVAALRAKYERVLKARLPASFRVGKSHRGDASTLPLADGSVDVVITSPPFLGSTHFLRQNRVRNWLLGWTYAEQQRRRDDFLEHKRDLEPYAVVLPELRRVVRPGGLAAFHVGIVKNDNMAEMLAPFFLEAGFSEVDTVWEDTTDLESHGRVDRGGTHTHGIVVLHRG
jgi:DNA modification methylase